MRHPGCPGRFHRGDHILLDVGDLRGAQDEDPFDALKSRPEGFWFTKIKADCCCGVPKALGYLIREEISGAYRLSACQKCFHHFCAHVAKRAQN